MPYEKPWGRTREYVEIVKQIVAREGRLEYEGKHFTLPLTEGEGVTGQGKALKLNIHPIRNEIPIYLGAIGRKSVELAAEVADGWIPIFFSVDKWEEAWGEHIEAGLAKSGRSREDFEVSPSVQVAIDGDLDAARGMVKAGLLLYLGGMGSKKTNFYADLTRRFGFAEVADEVQSLYLDGKREEAYAAIPDELVDATAMIGTEEEVAERVKRFADAGVDRMIVSPMHGNAEENARTRSRSSPTWSAPALPPSCVSEDPVRSPPGAVRAPRTSATSSARWTYYADDVVLVVEEGVPQHRHLRGQGGGRGVVR